MLYWQFTVVKVRYLERRKDQESQAFYVVRISGGKTLPRYGLCPKDISTLPYLTLSTLASPSYDSSCDMTPLDSCYNMTPLAT